MGTVELISPRRYLDFLNRVNFSEGVNFVFRFTEKFLRVAHCDLNHVLMEGLGSKSLIIHLESAKYV